MKANAAWVTEDPGPGEFSGRVPVTMCGNTWASPVTSSEESACSAGDPGGGLDPWVRKTPWRRAWQPTPVFLPGEPHGLKSLVAHSPYGRRDGHDLSD